MKLRVSAILVVLLFLGLTAGIGPQTPSGVLVLDLGGDIPEVMPWNPIMALFTEPKPTVLDKIVALREAAREDRIKGVVVRITTIGYSFGKAQEFREAILRYKKKTGKPVFAYLELEGGGNIEYYLATACDKIYLSPASSMLLNGLAMSRFYLGGLWPKIYVDMQVDKIKEYKTFGDMIGGKEMSEYEREMNNAILDSLYDQFLTDIASGRWTDKAKVKTWIDAAWMTSKEYLDAGAIDGTGYEDEIVKKIGGNALPEKEFLSMLTLRKPKVPGKRVAVVFASGNIVSGDEPTGPFQQGAVIASNPMVKKLEKALKDQSIEAVILRVDSGGGSALASDLIWEATQRVKAQKPIVVSMADVAGSGGYYIACGASSIVAQPATITGSIGIVTAHPSIGRLLAKVGIATASMGRGEFADFGRMDRPMTEIELKKQHDSLQSLYDLFRSRVSAGRKLTLDRVNEIGRGRVWTGTQAKEIGLVDKLGGFEEAADEVKRLLKLPADAELTLVYGHERVTLWKLITGRVEESVVERALTRAEIDLVRELRFQGLWQPGQPLAVMSEPIKVQ
jgi:protease IV